MVSRSSVRFTVTTPDGERCILSVAERPNGDLTLATRDHGFWRAPGKLIEAETEDPRHGKTVIRNKYSIHVSQNSKNDVNLIKFTTKYSDGTQTDRVHYTRAIKKNYLFDQVYTRRCSNLNDIVYRMKDDKGNPINICSMNHQFTLIFSIFVGPADKEFVAVRGVDFRFKQVRFKNFSLVIIWTFLSAMWFQAGMQYNVVTVEAFGPSEGYSEKECIELFKGQRSTLRSEYIALLTQHPATSMLAPIWNSAAFFKDADPSSFGYLTWTKSLIWTDEITSYIEAIKPDGEA